MSRKSLFHVMRIAKYDGPSIRIIADERVKKGTAVIRLNDVDVQREGGIDKLNQSFRILKENTSLMFDDDGNLVGFFGNLKTRGLGAAIGGLKQRVNFARDLALAQRDIEEFEKKDLEDIGQVQKEIGSLRAGVDRLLSLFKIK